MKEIHSPWDDGALRFLSEAIDQKSIKTHCGKRVKFELTSADRINVTCHSCLDFLKERDEMFRDMDNTWSVIDENGKVLINDVSEEAAQELFYHFPLPCRLLHNGNEVERSLVKSESSSEGTLER